MPSSIRAITFDVGGTLIEPYPSVGEVYGGVARRFGIQTRSTAQLSEAFLQAWKDKRQFDYSRLAWRNLVTRTFGDTLPEPRTQEVFQAIYDEFALSEAWRIYEDVAPTLDALGQLGYRLGLISNWDERLRPLLGTLRLSGRFEAVVISCEADALKPNAEIFHCAARLLQLPPHRILHVGDGREEDFEGAARAGFAAAHLRRGHQNGEWPVLDSLLDLIPALEKNT
jgi:putative hydrolase of the HAD superfamily